MLVLGMSDFTIHFDAQKNISKSAIVFTYFVIVWALFSMILRPLIKLRNKRKAQK